MINRTGGLSVKVQVTSLKSYSKILKGVIVFQKFLHISWFPSFYFYPSATFLEMLGEVALQYPVLILLSEVEGAVLATL